MRMRTHKGLTAIQQGIALLRRLGDRASAFIPGVGQPVGPVNLVLYSSDFSNGAWTKGAGIASLTSGLADPYGGPYATRVTPVSGGGCYLAQNIALLNSTTYTRVAIVKPETDNIVAMEFVDNGAYTNTIFNTTTKAVSGTATSGASVTDMGGGWFICLRTWTTGATGSQGAGAWYTNNYGAATSTNTMLIHRVATMQGAVTPAQVIASGIPLTANAAAAASYLPWINGASLSPTGGIQSLGLNLIANGDFPNGATGWTLWQPTAGVVQLESGGMRIRTTDATFAAIQPALTLSPGSTYQVTFTVRNWVNGSVQVSIDGTTAAFTSPSAAGTYTFPVVASGSCVVQIKRTGGSNCDLIVDDVSCQLLTTMPTSAWLMDYVESSANTAAAVDGPIGFLSDGVGTAGPELAPQSLLNWSYYNTPINVTDTSASADAAADGLFFTGLVVGQQYQLSFAGSSTTTITFQPYGSATIYQTGFGTAVFTAQEARFLLRFGGVGTATFTKMSVKQITGRHSTQSTGGNKPTLRRGIINQQQNSLVSSSVGSTYGWGITGTGTQPVITPNYGPDPWGGNTACRVQLTLNGGTTSADRCYFSSTAAPIDGVTRTSMTLVRTVSGTATILTRIYGTPVYYTIDTNWQLIWSTSSSTVDATHTLVEIRGGQSTVNSNTADLLIATHGVFLGTVTPAQVLQCGGIPITTSAVASSTAGNFALNYNGTSAALALQSLPYSVTDDHAVIQGLVPRDISATRPSYTAYASNSRYPVIYVGSGGLPTASWRDDAGTGPTLNFGAVTNGTPFVISARKVGSAVYVRKDGGGTLSGSIASLGTTTISAVMLGSSPPSSGFWSGEIYPTVVVKGAISDAELLVLERFVGALTGPTGVKF